MVMSPGVTIASGLEPYARTVIEVAIVTLLRYTTQIELGPEPITPSQTVSVFSEIGIVAVSGCVGGVGKQIWTSPDPEPKQ
jgi:hypothetical protein